METLLATHGREQDFPRGEDKLKWY